LNTGNTGWLTIDIANPNTHATRFIVCGDHTTIDNLIASEISTPKETNNNQKYEGYSREGNFFFCIHFETFLPRGFLTVCVSGGGDG